ncbi:protein O-GlcNAcase isoform X3 [Pseudoliparis swirei]|uniref:protein O-GlcNAcase isoform X3 n=1 Tax=Pseudoliparis swirei TaxID=2059687 RepID=UPI0024BEEB01|nr:protein O-GlcNAcase isoform X3 [Pseudoliparis swirei]
MSKPASAEGQARAPRGAKRFISGVVEGFYGRPWTMEQRTELFKREQKWGLNTYLYAPKDDYKHRMYWRDLYSAEESVQLIALISAAKQHDVDFIYAISPGLDITFSNPKEVAALKRKLDQVKQFGCSSFSLLFDDIEADMCPADKRAFSSFAHAQVAITNAVYQHLGDPETFLFCPTDYCAAFCTPSVSQSSYLHTVGEKLLPGIDVLWTGPKVVSHKISVESIDEVSSVLKRAPVIWDNIHANDYDPQRIYLGPFKDRPTELIGKLGGVLTNPNCEFHLNFVAVHTLATWCKATADGAQRDVEKKGDEEQDPCYSPQEALTLALTDWLQEFQSSDQPGGRCRPPAGLKKESSGEEPMQTDVGEGSYVPGAGENPLYTAEPLTLADLKLLSDIFHLPYEYGPTARTMLRELDWLKRHGWAVAAETDVTAEWRSRAQRFDGLCEAVVQMFNRLSNAPNRRILYDLYDYICDIKSGVGLARAYVKTLGGQGGAQPMTDDPEPWGFRGGLSGEFQRMLPCHGNRDLFRHPPTTAVYSIRPHRAEDTVRMLVRRRDTSKKINVSSIDVQVFFLAGGAKDFKGAAERRRGQGALDDAAATHRRRPVVGGDLPLPSVRSRPGGRDGGVRLRPGSHRRQAGRNQDSGSRGVFCELRQSDRRMLDFFSKLSSFKPVPTAGLPRDVVAVGTSL